MPFKSAITESFKRFNLDICVRYAMCGITNEEEDIHPKIYTKSTWIPDWQDNELLEDNLI